MADTTQEHEVPLHRSGRVHGTLVLVLLLLAAFLFAETVKSFKEWAYVGGGIPSANVITVTGTGEVFAKPDVGEFTFSVVEEGATVALVQEAATKKADAALAALKEKGVDTDKDVKTVGYNLAPKYEWEQPKCVGVWPCPPGKQVQKGFELNQSMTVKVRDLAKAGELIEAVTGAQVQNVGGLTFAVDDEEKVKAEARKIAIEQAKSKANELAGDLGVRLVRIVGYNEEGDYPIFFDRMEAAPMGLGGGDAMKASAPPVPTGENKIVSNVSISFEVR